MRWLVGVLIGWCLVGVALGQSDLSFPQIIVGESFETIVQVSNDVAVPDTVVLESFSEGTGEGGRGIPFPVQVNGGNPATESSFPISSFAEATFRLSLPGPLKAGWVRVRSTSPGGKISASLYYRILQDTQVLDSVGVTNSKRYRFAQIQVDDREQSASTGVAFINPDDAPVHITADLFQGEKQVGHFEQELEPLAHLAKLVSELFPSAGKIAGTLVLEASANRSIPILTLKIDGTQLTSLPVRPFGFSLQYEIRGESGDLAESGYWTLDSEGFSLFGSGWKDGDTSGSTYTLAGSWIGTGFQCLMRPAEAGSPSRLLVFVGSSAGQEITAGQPITGKVTEFDSEGRVLSTRNFTAFNKY